MTKSMTKKIVRNLDDALDEVLHQLRKAGEGVSEEARESFIEASVKLRHAAENVADEARREARHLTRSAIKEVRSHPTEAAVLAVGAVALIGLLLVRRFQPSA